MARDDRSVMRFVAVLVGGAPLVGAPLVGMSDRRDRVRGPDQLVSTRRAVNGADGVRDGLNGFGKSTVSGGWSSASLGSASSHSY